MIGVKTVVTKAAMSGLYHSGAHRLLAPYTQRSRRDFHAQPCAATAGEGLCAQPRP